MSCCPLAESLDLPVPDLIHTPLARSTDIAEVLAEPFVCLSDQ